MGNGSYDLPPMEELLEGWVLLLQGAARVGAPGELRSVALHCPFTYKCMLWLLHPVPAEGTNLLWHDISFDANGTLRFRVKMHVVPPMPPLVDATCPCLRVPRIIITMGARPTRRQGAPCM